MTKPETTATPSIGPVLAVFSSLLLPGLGQGLLKKWQRGLLILLTGALSAYLINRSFARLNIGKVTMGGWTTSWLWFPFICFWVWNVLDTRALAIRRPL
ncbi:MAG TPA: hypothetical protein VHM28_01135, partial [Anaerolineales bacterium]|nr:hypothetical protein [Anaerolineales bacterium]